MRRETLHEITRKVLLAEADEGFFGRIGTAVSKTFSDARRRVFGMTDEEKVNAASQLIERKLDELSEKRRATSARSAAEIQSSLQGDSQLAVVIVDSKGKQIVRLNPPGENAIPDFDKFSQACVSLTGKAREFLMSSSLVFSDTNRWIYNFWQIDEELQSLKIREDIKARMGAIAANYLKSCMLDLPICWVAANTSALDNDERNDAWSKFGGLSVSPQTMAYHSYGKNMSYINLVTFSGLRSLGLQDAKQLNPGINIGKSAIIHEIMHAKSDYLDDVVKVFKLAFAKLEYTEKEQSASGKLSAADDASASTPSASSSDESARTRFTEKYRRVVKSGWGATIAKSQRPEDASQLFALMMETFRQAVDINEDFYEELIANFDALLRIILESSGLDTHSFLLPDVTRINENQLLLALIGSGRGAVPGIPGYKFDYRKGPDGVEVIGLTSTYVDESGVNMPLALDGVSRARDRAEDLADDEHVYNALNLLQNALEAIKREGLRFDKDGTPMSVIGRDLTAGSVMKQIASGKYITVGREDLRRMACLLVAASKSRRGDLSPDIFEAIDTLAVRDTPARSRAGSRAGQVNAGSDVRSA